MEITEEILLPRPEETVAIAIRWEKTAAMCYDRVWSPSAQWRSPSTAVPDSIRFYCGTSPEHALLKNLYRREPLVYEIMLLLKQRLEQWNLAEIKSVKHLFEMDAELSEMARAELSKDQLNRIILGKLDDVDRRSISSDFVNFLESFIHIIHLPIQSINKDYLVKLINDERFEDVLKYAYGISYVQREITRSLAETYGIRTVNIYDSENARKNEFTEGDRRVVIASLEGLGIIDESALTWNQIIDFRKDMNARRKYLRFLHWLDKDMIGRSPDFIQEEISLRLEDYERSLKKHGIKTVIGTVSEVLNGQYVLGSSGIAAGLSLSGHPVLGFLVGAGLLIGKIAVKISETALSFDDNELGSNSEVSWVYKVKQLPKRRL